MTVKTKSASRTVKPWRVVQQSGARVNRIVFRGLEHDARRYVQDHFPRPHVDEFTANPDNPVHDVKLVAPNGTEEVYNSGTHDNGGWMPRPDYANPEEVYEPETEDEYELLVNEDDNV